MQTYLGPHRQKGPLMQTEFHHYSFTPHAGALDLLLVRHGECEPAIAGHPFSLVDGHGDPALHADGAAQAITVGARLRDEPLMPLYVTILRRTHQTVAPLEVHLGLTPVIEADFREVYFGDWEGGLFRIKATQSAPEALRARAQQDWGEIPGAETCAALQSRVSNALWRLAERHPDQQISAFGHGRVIGAALAVATGAQNFAFNGSANGAISRLVLTEGRMVLRGFNDCAHLG